MILRVGSPNIETFKAVTFRPGLNLVLADKTEESSDTDTRNGVGKSLLIDIIHFCLGGSLEKDNHLNRLADREASFFVEIELNGKSVKIGRGVKKHETVLVAGLPDEWLSGHKHERNLLDEGVTMKASVLNDILGEQWFGLSYTESVKFGPSFRSVFGFIARNAKGAFLDPFESFSQMPASQKQVLNTFLLGLGWEYAVQWEEWRQLSEKYQKTKKAIESGLVPGFGSVGELESELAKVRREHEKVKNDLDNFRVLSEYEEIKRRANRITREMQERQNKNVSDGELLRMYEANLEVEEDTAPENLVRLYEEAGVVLVEAVVKQLSEVKQFHQELVTNRRRFLEDEIRSIGRRIEEREVANQSADREKSDLLQTLKTAGALEEFTSLQTLNAELAGRISSIERRLEDLANLALLQSQVDEQRIDLERATRNDHIDRKPLREEALGRFDEYVRRLYNCGGDLVINVDKTGFKFNSKIERDDAEGIGKMKILCYDLLLAWLWASKPTSPRFLIHDTTLYDGVEERQRGHALELAEYEAREGGFQYISFWNTDFLPSDEYLGKLNISDHVVLRLDDTEAGSLLGFRF